MRSRTLLVAMGLVTAGVVGGVLLWLFQPWALVTTTTVDEALPSAVPATGAPPAGGTATPSAPARSAAPSTPPTPPGPVVVARGEFRSYEHETTGTASLVRVGDRVVVRFTDFATSNGPDVKVWLSRAPVGQADGARDAGYLDLGELKGNRGNQNYEVPAGTDLDRFRSVVVWCDRFSVAFGAAGLGPV